MARIEPGDEPVSRVDDAGDDEEEVEDEDEARDADVERLAKALNGAGTRTDVARRLAGALHGVKTKDKKGRRKKSRFMSRLPPSVGGALD